MRARSRDRQLPEGYTLVPWDRTLLDAHAEALYRSFQGEIDSVVFPSLGNRTGCAYLMNEISRKSGFTPEATWLVRYGETWCATVQGVRERSATERFRIWVWRPPTAAAGSGASCYYRRCTAFSATAWGGRSWKSRPRMMEQCACIGGWVFAVARPSTRPSRRCRS